MGSRIRVVRRGFVERHHRCHRGAAECALAGSAIFDRTILLHRCVEWCPRRLSSRHVPAGSSPYGPRPRSHRYRLFRPHESSASVENSSRGWCHLPSRCYDRPWGDVRCAPSCVRKHPQTILEILRRAFSIGPLPYPEVLALFCAADLSVVSFADRPFLARKTYVRRHAVNQIAGILEHPLSR